VIPLHIHEAAYVYCETQLELTMWWDLPYDSCDAFIATAHPHTAAAGWLRGQNTLASDWI
jgi:hypothetical protein